jgi:type I restriction-modification system DNA methylase subunit
VLFVDASEAYTRGLSSSYLTEHHQAVVLSAFADFTNSPNLAAVVSVNDIAERDHNLSIVPYVARASAIRGIATSTFPLVESWGASEVTGHALFDELDELGLWLDSLAD